MLELYLDSADLEAIAQLAPVLPVAGVTTNPTIMAAGGMGLQPLLASLVEILGQGSRFHVQVLADTVEGMLAEARQLQALPYLNRIDNLGGEGLSVVADLQRFIEQYQLPGKLLVASFKNVQQVLQVLRLGVAAVTLPVDIARQMLATPAADAAVAQFNQDWQAVFPGKLSYQS